MLPRSDIAPLITEALLAEMSDKNWKTRNEGLTKLQSKILINFQNTIFKSMYVKPLLKFRRYFK